MPCFFKKKGWQSLLHAKINLNISYMYERVYCLPYAALHYSIPPAFFIPQHFSILGIHCKNIRSRMLKKLYFEALFQLPISFATHYLERRVQRELCSTLQGTHICQPTFHILHICFLEILSVVFYSVLLNKWKLKIFPTWIECFPQDCTFTDVFNDWTIESCSKSWTKNPILTRTLILTSKRLMKTKCMTLTRTT